MLIAPESYYETEVKGKSISHIKAEIRRLRREFNEDRQLAEETSHSEVFMEKPSYSMRAQFDLEYLEKAKQALIEAGGVYVPTKAEERNKQFNAKVKTITNIHISYGGFWDGFECRNLFFDKRSVFIQSYKMPLEGEYQSFKIYQHYMDTSRFLKEIELLNLGDWKKYYCNDILDGTEWTLELTFSNGKVKKFCGCNAFPYNFDKLIALLDPEEE